jgi:hypothetical protein
MPIFDKFPYSLRSQGDKNMEEDRQKEQIKNKGRKKKILKNERKTVTAWQSWLMCCFTLGEQQF